MFTSKSEADNAIESDRPAERRVCGGRGTGRRHKRPGAVNGIGALHAIRPRAAGPGQSYSRSRWREAGYFQFRGGRRKSNFKGGLGRRARFARAETLGALDGSHGRIHQPAEIRCRIVHPRLHISDQGQRRRKRVMRRRSDRHGRTRDQVYVVGRGSSRRAPIRDPSDSLRPGRFTSICGFARERAGSFIAFEPFLQNAVKFEGRGGASRRSEDHEDIYFDPRDRRAAWDIAQVEFHQATHAGISAEPGLADVVGFGLSGVINLRKIKPLQSGVRDARNGERVGSRGAHEWRQEKARSDDHQFFHARQFFENAAIPRPKLRGTDPLRCSRELCAPALRHEQRDCAQAKDRDGSRFRDGRDD